MTEVAKQWNVDRSTLHRWLARYELEGLEGLGDRTHRPESCPHQMPAAVEAMVLALRAAADLAAKVTRKAENTGRLSNS